MDDLGRKIYKYRKEKGYSQDYMTNINNVSSLEN